MIYEFGLETRKKRDQSQFITVHCDRPAGERPARGVPLGRLELSETVC